MTPYCQVETTTETKGEAMKLARLLVERKLAACVQIVGPITSVYRWKGEIETAEEWRFEAKTREDLFGELAGVIREAHSYDVPEILATWIEAGSESYLAWLEEELKPASISDGK